MLSEPKIEHRDKLNYVAMRSTVTMPEIPSKLPQQIGMVYSWLQRQGLHPTGAPFFRYISMHGDTLGVDVGFPVAHPVQSDAEVICGNFPAGNYVTVLYTGNYTGLRDAHMKLEEWSNKTGNKPTSAKDTNGQLLGTRTEHYLSDPNIVKDPNQWETVIMYLVKED
ncbi:MAG: hypothetical protein C5B52_17695 [Bacteroidetes bacterium]|nr:MAG: hypothetical protein C5B52_17695 [Bacteroidota bacterium]